MSTTAGRSELPVGVRVIRRLSPPDAPWPASLARTDDGASRMLVDSAVLQDWNGWDATPGGHVLGPLDLLRRADGHDVLLPLCTERLEALLARRVGLPLTSGEVVTIAVSILRGMTEVAQRDTGDSCGSWWLTAEGRPVFVDELEAEPAVATTVDVLGRIASAADPSLTRVLRDAAETVGDSRALTRELTEIEDRLYEIAAPEPLATAPLASRTRHTSAPAHDPVDQPEGGSRSWATALLASVDTDLADTLSRATTGLWRRLRRPARRSRRRAWALAGCLGAAVIAIGLAWPAPGGPAVAVTSTPAAGTPATAAASADSAPPAPDAPTAVPPSAPAGADLVAVTDALLETRRSCGAGKDEACAADVLEDPARILPAGIVDAAADERTLTLLDEFGGVAVLRADSVAGDTPAQLIVIADVDGRWLLRDVHTVAEQP